MNLATIPLLLVALLMMSAEPGVETARLVLEGTHQIDPEEGAVIVGDAEVAIPAGVEMPGPVYVIGGELTVSGVITGDLVQLAGTVTVEPGAAIGDELRHVAGTVTVSDDAEIGRRTRIDLTGDDAGRAAGLLPIVAVTALLAGAGYLLSRKWGSALANVAGAATGHPVVALTVGFLLVLTSIALVVFMALTLLLLPVAAVAVVAGLATLGYGVIAWGYALGSRLPIRRAELATVVGVVVVMVVVQLAGRIPLIGDLAVAGALLTGLGAVALTHFGAGRFRPAELPD